MRYFDRRFYWGLLHPKLWGTWIAIGVLLFFGALPAWLRDPFARALSKLVLSIAKKPIRVAKANIRTCFPDKSEAEVDALVRENVAHFVMILIGQAELLFGSKEHLRRRVNLHGFEHVQAAREAGQPVIFIMPHVWGIDYAGLRLNLDLPMVTMAKAHRNELFNWFSNRIRSRLGGHVYMREAGLRVLISEMRQGNSFFYLPDEDLGPDQSVFAPLFATTKATLPVVGRLAAAGNAQVMPVVIGYDDKAHRFELTVLPAIEEDTMRGKENEALALNRAVEQVISAYPEQYMWFLKLLRTRPPGEPSIYD
ncbi:lauroyl-Kdo(2)-lipid IV(A) myristoyltransferase [Shewanella litorisediminis]|uniref:Lauroyl-Kdo(2)-lipid IV(A) myristoyltransferase n=1 Tax=Shewanella litorisediminis TaxID=1173586 RepID=A0ABX7FYW8_9GAMM|nr:lauroyl-Kdo(2)-lipid IV(A) myristoyltransferase [Shewanella litorisediminis]MCL2918792.1 lauroyl-Kdo(2)-lipid IV(A) myristoyltransferase [Shewanella litorisediminis]QRH00238.1 lauroyl-Kdo(2)-lipid IV(A) myristoyltransferase [Shewanella litorisediminis]